MTDAGERLLRSIGPRFDEIESEISALTVLRDKPAGTLRITTVEHAADTILWPKIAKLLAAYPDINVEIVSAYSVTDIVAERYDAGVRLGEQVDKDMIAVPIGPDLRIAVVAAPSYFKVRSKPLNPEDLTKHSCINLRLPTHGAFYAWEFRKGRRELKVRVQGRAAFNTIGKIQDAVLKGLGLGYLPEDQVEAAIKSGRLVRVLADWCPPRPGYHMYYPSRRHPTPAFALLVDALRHRKLD